MAKSLGKEYRLGGHSVREIAAPFEEATLRVGAATKFNGRKLKSGPLLNALVLRFLEDMTADEQVAYGREAVARLEAFLGAQADPAADAATARPARDDRVGHPAPRPGDDAKPRRRNSG